MKIRVHPWALDCTLPERIEIHVDPRAITHIIPEHGGSKIFIDKWNWACEEDVETLHLRIIAAGGWQFRLPDEIVWAYGDMVAP